MSLLRDIYFNKTTNIILYTLLENACKIRNDQMIDNSHKKEQTVAELECLLIRKRTRKRNNFTHDFKS